MPMLPYVHVRDHAIERARERFYIFKRTRQVLVEAVHAGVPFGGQLGSDYLLKHGEMVLVCRPGHRTNIVVVTVLTLDQAYANMQAVTKSDGW